MSHERLSVARRERSHRRRGRVQLVFEEDRKIAFRDLAQQDLHRDESYIKTTPERLWEAITDPEMRSKYSFGTRVSSDWTPGSRYEATGPDGTGVWVEGENLEVEPRRRLVQSMTALWSEDVKREGQSRVTWEIEPVGDSCRLTVIHDELREGANDELYGGWPMILSALKTLLETGEQLTTPASLRFSEASSDQVA